jgi:hypothetical protein
MISDMLDLVNVWAKCNGCEVLRNRLILAPTTELRGRDARDE